MLLTEYNEAKQMELFREEGREEGRAEGRAEGREEGRAEGREEGRAEGRTEGIIEQAITTAKHMLADGQMTLQKISEYTQLPLEKVKELAVALKA